MLPVRKHREFFLAENPEWVDTNHDIAYLLLIAGILEEQPNQEASGPVARYLAQDLELLQLLAGETIRICNFNLRRSMRDTSGGCTTLPRLKDRCQSILCCLNIRDITFL